MKIFYQQYKTGVHPLFNNILANLAMLALVILWGVSFSINKIVLSEVPPITLALIRFLIATTILFPILKKVEPSSKLQKSDFPKMALSGFLGITLYFYLQNAGVALTTASNASLIASVTPILAITMDVIIYRTKISVAQVLGIGCATIGAYLAVTANRQIDLSSTTFKGNLIMVGAMFSWALYTLLNKSLQGKYSEVFLITYQMLFGTLFLTLMFFTEYDQWRVFSPKAFGYIVFLAVFSSALCFFLYGYALKKLDVVITTLYLNLVPIVGVFSGWCILGEIILPVQFWGGVIIILGIVVINWEKFTMPSNRVGQ
ncbi:DMT family transporter [Desulfosporosinus nitroreducens]|uniref:DMT family transporter n=1 Tax=Desulfosporosinus nitroreducens TaxID=2018668 RepID=UPI00207D7168|nr:DMT family transporter [Desulfosporosinus nitroreducens]MCO1604535.1 DMT family transporter [Desulfosporosinus nitroreducens]